MLPLRVHTLEECCSILASTLVESAAPSWHPNLGEEEQPLGIPFGGEQPYLAIPFGEVEQPLDAMIGGGVATILEERFFQLVAFIGEERLFIIQERVSWFFISLRPKKILQASKKGFLGSSTCQEGVLGDQFG